MLPERVSALAFVEKILSINVFYRGVILVGDVICGIWIDFIKKRQ